jgi:hypothetical protein
MKIDEIRGSIKYCWDANKLEWLGKQVQYMQAHELRIFLGWLMERYGIDQDRIDGEEQYVEQTKNKNGVVHI